jgi:hypothetical protein
MTDDPYQRPDDGRVLNTALVAVMLIVTGLGLMVWDNYRAGPGRDGAVTMSALQNP